MKKIFRLTPLLQLVVKIQYDREPKLLSATFLWPSPAFAILSTKTLLTHTLHSINVFRVYIVKEWIAG